MLGLLGKVAEPVMFESGETRDDKIVLEECLQRDHNLLPGCWCAVALVDAGRGLLEPAGGEVFAAQFGGVVIGSKPWGINNQPFRKIALEPV